VSTIRRTDSGLGYEITGSPIIEGARTNKEGSPSFSGCKDAPAD